MRRSDSTLRILAPLGRGAMDAAWLAQDQNQLLKVAFGKVEMLRHALDADPVLFDLLLDLERVLEDMEQVNRATLMAARSVSATRLNTQPRLDRVSHP